MEDNQPTQVSTPNPIYQQVLSPPSQSNNQQQYSSYKKGSFLERAFALIIDSIIIAFIQILFFFAAFTIKVPIFTYLSIFITAIYNILFLGSIGATPGMKLFKLKVLTLSYQRISFPIAILRETVGKFFSGLIFNIGYYWVLIDTKRQTWHDKIAKTYVVKLDQSGNLVPSSSDEVITTGQKISFWILVLLFGTPLAAIGIFLVVYLFLFRPFMMSNASMYPTLNPNAYLLTNIIVYKTSDPQRDDIIVFKFPDSPNKDLIKRIIAIPGDTVMLKDGNLYLNGQILDESKYIKTGIKTFGGIFLHDGQEITVPQGEYFVLGDNRAYSADSKDWGFVTRDSIISKYVLCYWNCSGEALSSPTN